MIQKTTNVVPHVGPIRIIAPLIQSFRDRPPNKRCLRLSPASSTMATSDEWTNSLLAPTKAAARRATRLGDDTEATRTKKAGRWPACAAASTPRTYAVSANVSTLDPTKARRASLRATGLRNPVGRP